MRNDPRTRYTEMIIKKALLELLHHKPMSKITVREICDRAEINRSTFYKHYLDCYDLLDKLKEETLTQFDELMDGLDRSGATPALLATLNALEQNAETFQLIAPGSGGGEFTRQVVQRCYQYLDMRFAELNERGWDKGQKETCYAFLIGGISSVIERWMQCGCKEPAEEVAATIMKLSEIMTSGLTEK